MGIKSLLARDTCFPQYASLHDSHATTPETAPICSGILFTPPCAPACVRSSTPRPMPSWLIAPNEKNSKGAEVCVCVLSPLFSALAMYLACCFNEGDAD